MRVLLKANKNRNTIFNVTGRIKRLMITKSIVFTISKF